jgi:cholesterol oxidase
MVLERGRDYRDRQFPRTVTDAASLFWKQPGTDTGPASWRGLYDVRFFSGIGVVTASGLGGGSLIYANIHVRPDAGVFDDPAWPAGIRRQTLEPYYQRVSAMLRLAPPPADLSLPKRDMFHAAAARLGREAFDPEMAVAWREPPGPGRQPCQLAAECEFGCPYGAKHSLDVTYLAEAERQGAELRTGVFATWLEPDGAGYRVHYLDTADGTVSSVTGTRVVVAAGTLGTNELLLRSRDEARSLSKLSTALGHSFSGNGDFLGSIQNSAADLQPWLGPDVVSVMRFTDSTPHFTLAAPTFNRSTMSVLAAHGQPRLHGLRFLSPLLWPLMERILPRLFTNEILTRPPKLRMRNAGDPARMTNLFAIGRDNANGRMRLRRGRLDVMWRYASENRELIAKMTSAMEAVAQAYGGTFGTLFTWQIFQRIITVHPLGGCRLADSPQTGVVSPDGEVFGYPGLFIADGSVIPTSLGFHPCMTISALAERTADAVAASYPS